MSITGPLLHGSQSGNSITAQDTSHEQFGHLNLSLFLEKGCIPFLSHHQAAKFNQIPEPLNFPKNSPKKGKGDFQGLSLCKELLQLWDAATEFQAPAPAWVGAWVCPGWHTEQPGASSCSWDGAQEHLEKGS